MDSHYHILLYLVDRGLALIEANENFVLNFYDELATRFGVPKFIIVDNALAFVWARTTNWAL